MTPSKGSVSDRGIVASQTLMDFSPALLRAVSLCRVEKSIAADFAGLTDSPLKANQVQR